MNARAKWLLGTLLLAALAAAYFVRHLPGAARPHEPGMDWVTKVGQTTVARGEVITLVVHSARDCKYCLRWKAPMAGQEHFESWAREHPGTQMFIVERASVAGNEAPDDYPGDLRWLSDRYQKDERVHPGTPAFEIFIGQKLVLRAYGLDAWDNEVFPAIKDLDARRSSSGRGA